MDAEARRSIANALSNLCDCDVLTDAVDTAPYEKDYSGYEAPAELVVRPRGASDVAKLLRYCHGNGIAVVPSGGRTGFCGGATPSRDAIVLSLERLNTIEPVDTVSHSLRTGAGAITQHVHEHCEAAGLTWPIDLASRGASQIGGNISTNAGGINVVRYGMTRNWVLGLEVATMRGEILRLDRPLVKNNTGWDIMQLFIGSEGTLGVITAAVLRLAPAVSKRCTAFFAVRDEEALKELVGAVRSAPFPLLALEFLDVVSLERAVAYYNSSAPTSARAPYYVIVEYERAGYSQDDVETWLATLDLDGLVDAVVAQRAAQRSNMWLMREGLGEAWVSLGHGRTHDVSVPVSDAPDFLRRLRQRSQEVHPDWKIYACGHLGDGNIHTHLVASTDLNDAQRADLWKQYDEFVFRIVVEDYRGSVSAEHGIGLSKKPYLSWCRSPEELEIFRAVKAHFDPKGLLNPGKIFDSENRSTALSLL